MNEERLFILKMVEDGKITADEAEALLEALDEEDRWEPAEGRESSEGGGGDERGNRRGTEGRAEEGPRPGEKGARRARGMSQDLAGQIRESVQAALKNVPHVTEELRENWHEVRRDVRRSLREIKEEMKKGPLVDVSGLADLFSHLRGFSRGPAHDFEETFTGEWDAGLTHPRIRLGTRNGNVSVVGWDQPTYKVITRKRVYGHDESKAEDLAGDAVDATFDEKGMEVVARAADQLAVSVAVSIEAWVPQGRTYQVSASSRNGSIGLEGVAVGAGSLATTNGAVKVRQVTGERLEAGTTNGKVVCDDVTADEVEARTTNGDIVWVGSARDVELTTTNGSIRLKPGVPFTPPSSGDDSSHADRDGGEESGRVAATETGAEAPGAKTSRYTAHTMNAGIRVRLPNEDTVGVRFEAKGRSVELQGAENAFILDHHDRPRLSRHVSGVSAHFDAAHKRLIFDLKTTNGSVYIENGSEEEEEANPDEG